MTGCTTAPPTHATLLYRAAPDVDTLAEFGATAALAAVRAELPVDGELHREGECVAQTLLRLCRALVDLQGVHLVFEGLRLADGDHSLPIIKIN